MLYADDVSCIIGTAESARHLAELLSQFAQVSGLHINLSKTQAYGIGNWSYRQFYLPFPVTAPDERLLVDTRPIRILGILMQADLDTLARDNLQTKLDSMSRVLNSWYSRSLTLAGKILTLKTLGLSLLQYPMTCVTVPKTFKKEVDKACFRYIWNNKQPKIARANMIQDYDAGLKAPCVFTIVKAIQWRWLDRMLLDPQALWCFFPNRLLNRVGGIEYVLDCNFDVRWLPFDLPPFYEQIFKCWSELNCHDVPLSAECIRQEKVLNNRYVRPQNTMVYEESLRETRAERIGGWFSPIGVLWTYRQFCDLYGPKISGRCFLQICSAIPQSWKDALIQQICLPDSRERLVTSVNSAKTRWLQAQARPIKAIDKWQTNMGIDPTRWKSALKASRKYTTEVKMQVFQFRLMHRIIPTGSRLFVYKILPTDGVARAMQTRTR
jgi:hypothetical protein